MTLGGLTVLGHALAAEESVDGSSDGADSTGVLLMLTGAGLVVAGTIHDIATADDAVREHNQHQLQLAPTAIKDSAGNTSAGFVVAGRF